MKVEHRNEVSCGCCRRDFLQALGMTESLLGRWRMLQNRLAAVHTSASRSGATASSA